jgi:hypothetical protein
MEMSRVSRVFSRLLWVTIVGLLVESRGAQAAPSPVIQQSNEKDMSLFSPKKKDALYVSTYGLAIRATPSDNAGSPYAAETGFGFGVAAGWRREVMGVEIGLQQLDRRFSVGDEQISTEYTHVPISLRIWLGDFFSFGFGPSLALGSGTVVVANSNDLSQVRNISFEAASLRRLDVGFLTNALVQILPQSSIGMTLGAQYSFSLLNHASSGDFRYSDLQFLAGIRIGKLSLD